MQTPITGRNTLPVAQKPIHTYIHTQKRTWK